MVLIIICVFLHIVFCFFFFFLNNPPPPELSLLPLPAPLPISPFLTLKEWWNPNRRRDSTRSRKASACSTRNTSSRPTRSWRISGNGNTASRSCSSRGSSRRSEEHTSELQSPCNLVCRLLLEKK